VDVEQVALMADKVGLQNDGKKKFNMMHNKDMVSDEVYTFSLPDSQGE
jgi:hypothetical protein